MNNVVEKIKVMFARSFDRKIYAFTLAEVLITLAVIGVLAALSIPSLMNSTNDAEFTAAAKKAFAVASNAYKLAVVENGGGFGPRIESHDPNTYTKFNAMKAQFNVTKECPYNSGSFGNCWSNTGVGKKDYSVSGCLCWTNSSFYQNRNNSFVSSDGMYWMMYTYDTVDGNAMIAVDVNGEKGPNDWGKDVFSFIMDDTAITMNYLCGNLQHNDGSAVDIDKEFIDRILGN